MFWQTYFIALFVSAVVLFIVLFIGLTPPLTKTHSDKNSPIECGFEDHLKGARSPFSLYFFIISVLFLVFDVETVLLFPAPMALNNFFSSDFSFNIFLFLFVLLAGLIHETRQGALKWAS